jgi:hypothetical protein
MVCLVAVAMWIDLRDEPRQSQPFAAADLAAGQRIPAHLVEWREIPRGLMTLPDLRDAVAVRPLERGDPITASAVAGHQPPPRDWWSVELPLPEGTTAGARARVVVDDPPLATEAIVVSVERPGAFDTTATGLVAVPARYADALARAAARNGAIVLVAP